MKCFELLTIFITILMKNRWSLIKYSANISKISFINSCFSTPNNILSIDYFISKYEGNHLSDNFICEIQKKIKSQTEAKCSTSNICYYIVFKNLSNKYRFCTNWISYNINWMKSYIGSLLKINFQKFLLHWVYYTELL